MRHSVDVQLSVRLISVNGSNHFLGLDFKNLYLYYNYNKTVQLASLLVSFFLFSPVTVSTLSLFPPSLLLLTHPLLPILSVFTLPFSYSPTLLFSSLLLLPSAFCTKHHATFSHPTAVRRLFHQLSLCMYTLRAHTQTLSRTHTTDKHNTNARFKHT